MGNVELEGFEVAGPKSIEKTASFEEDPVTQVVPVDGEPKVRRRRRPTLMQRIGSNFSEFAEHTSAHGVPRIYTAPTWGKRSVWLALFVLCVTLFIYQAVLIVQRFLRNDIIVGVELKFENIPFPSVTVCNLNPYKNSLARSMGSVRDTLIAFDSAIEQSHEQPRRRKRSPATEPSLVESACTQTNDGLHVPEPDGDTECLCLHSARSALTYECAPATAWEQRECECAAGQVFCLPDSTQSRDPKTPCFCRDGFCVQSDFDELEGVWPIAFATQTCSCPAPDAVCHAVATGNASCLCATPINSQTPYCLAKTAWRRSKCAACNWQAECVASVALDADADCLCHGNKCLAVQTASPSIALPTAPHSPESRAMSHIRVRRQVRRVYEKIYNRYDGLLAVYSMCQCQDGQCQALKDSATGNVCLCFFNRKNSQIWPCYPPVMWSERRCHKCSPLGDCAFSEDEGGQLPCVCAEIIRMCVRIEEPSVTQASPFQNDNVSSTELTEEFALADRIPKMWEITTTPEPVPEDVQEREEAYGFQGVSDPVAIRAKASENLVFAVNSLPEEEKSALSYSKREMITKCSFNGRQCSVERDFDVYIDPSFGNCFTFNYNISEKMTSERAGASYGLRFQVFVNITDYLPTTEAAGVRLTVHSPDEQPFPDTHGYSAPTGFVSSFGIRLKRVDRLPAPYGNCVVDGKDDEYIFTDKEYSTEGCQRSCIQRHLIRMCGCGDPRFPRYRNHTNCPVGDPKLRECLRTQFRSAALDSHCICKQPCNQEVYSVSYSCARWPASTSSLSDCEPSLTPVQCLQFYREQGALIEVYFEQLNYESLKESEAYGFPNLLSDFGGQLGLWLGVSVITMCEVIILVCELFHNIFCCGILGSHRRSGSVRSERMTSRMSSRRYPNGSLRYSDILPRPMVINGKRSGSPPLPHVESGYDIVRSIR